MPAVQRFLDKLGAAFPMARQRHAHDVEIMIGGGAGALRLKFFQDMTQLGGGEACPYDRAMQVCAEFPNPRPSRGLHRRSIGFFTARLDVT